MSENGQAHFKNFAAFAATFLKCVWPFWALRIKEVPYQHVMIGTLASLLVHSCYLLLGSIECNPLVLLVYGTYVLAHLIHAKLNAKLSFSWLPEVFRIYFNPLSVNFTKWSNTLKQFVGKLQTNCLSVFDHFMGLVLKGLRFWINHSCLAHSFVS